MINRKVNRKSELTGIYLKVSSTGDDIIFHCSFLLPQIVYTNSIFVQMKISFKEETEVFEYPSYESSKEDVDVPSNPAAQLKNNTPKGSPGNVLNYFD